MTIYAVGDIHGQLGMLEDALAKIEKDGGSNAEVVFLGDLVDRGPDSKGVIDLLSRGVAEGRNWTVLKGNHDRLYSYFLRPQPIIDTQILVGYHWLHPRIGGAGTLESYGLTVPDQVRYYQLLPEALAAVPQSHIDFMNGLPAHHQVGDLFFVHAGLKPGVALEDQSEDDKIWIRREFHDHTDPWPWLVVLGHSPVDAPTHYGNRVNLDSGTGYGRPMTTAVFEGQECFVLSDKGRAPLLALA
jgi:serine/threonine protein phosphatase 1